MSEKTSYVVRELEHLAQARAGEEIRALNLGMAKAWATTHQMDPCSVMEIASGSDVSALAKRHVLARRIDGKWHTCAEHQAGD